MENQSLSLSWVSTCSFTYSIRNFLQTLSWFLLWPLSNPLRTISAWQCDPNIKLKSLSLKFLDTKNKYVKKEEGTDS